MSGVDPFRAVQEDVKNTFAEIQGELAKWRKLPSKSPKAEPARQRILSSLSELQVDLQDMQATIDIALKDPTKFALTPSELMTRQEFVRDLQAQANDACDTLEGTVAHSNRVTAVGTTVRESRQTLLGDGVGRSDHDVEQGGSCGGGGARAACEEHGAAWHDNENACTAAQQQHEQILVQQEAELTTIGRSVDRLGEMGKAINAELKQQGKELDAFTEEVEDVSGKMTQATAVMKKMLKKNNRGQLCAILVLSIVMIILVYAVIAW